MLHIAQKFDVAGRDERNRALGRAGEERVLAHERSALRSAGVQHLHQQVSLLAPIREHRMIRRAIEPGLPEEKIARALGLCRGWQTSPVGRAYDATRTTATTNAMPVRSSFMPRAEPDRPPCRGRTE